MTRQARMARMDPPEITADELITKLSRACKRQGLATDVIEPSTRLKVFAPTGNAHLDEIVTLRPNVGEVLTWYWSWDAPICRATDIETAVERIKHVVSARLS